MELTGAGSAGQIGDVSWRKTGKDNPDRRAEIQQLQYLWTIVEDGSSCAVRKNLFDEFFTLFPGDSLLYCGAGLKTACCAPRLLLLLIFPG
jgi:hypothetical protein